MEKLKASYPDLDEIIDDYSELKTYMVNFLNEEIATFISNQSKLENQIKLVKSELENAATKSAKYTKYSQTLGSESVSQRELDDSENTIIILKDHVLISEAYIVDMKPVIGQLKERKIQVLGEIINKFNMPSSLTDRFIMPKSDFELKIYHDLLESVDGGEGLKYFKLDVLKAYPSLTLFYDNKGKWIDKKTRSKTKSQMSETFINKLKNFV